MLERLVLRETIGQSTACAKEDRSPSPADVQPPAPSDTPFPQEPSNENFSAEYTVEITGFTDGEPKRITGTEQELKDQLLDFHDIDSRLEMVDYYGFDEDDYEKAVKMLTEKWNEKSLKTICDNDDMLTLIETKEALGLFGKKDEEEKERTERRDGQTVLERTEVFTPNSVPVSHVSRVSTPFRAVFFTRHANAVDCESE